MSEIYVGPKPPRSHARLWISTLLLTIYAAFVLLVTMWPSPKQLEFDGISSRLLRALHNLGVPEWFGYDKLEFTANIAMFVPLGFLLGLALPRRGWWVAVFAIPAFSGAIEITQGLALSERVSTMFDVLANTIGGLLGLLFAMIIRAMIHVRDRTMIERELWDRRNVAAQVQRSRSAIAVAHGARPAEPDPATKILDTNFWDANEAPTERISTR